VRGGFGSRAFEISGKTTSVSISGLTIRDGNVTVPGGISFGGGVYNKEANLTLEGVIVRNNTASANGGPAQSGGIAEGGGIYNSGGTLSLLGSSLIANLATAVGGSGKFGGIAAGGGVSSLGTFTISGSNLDENTSDARGGQGPANKEQGGGIAQGGGLFSVVNTGVTPTLSATTAHANLANASSGPGETSGGIANGGGVFLVTNGPAVTFSGPTASANSALAAGGTGAGPAGISQGGGLFLITNALPLSLTDATVTGNSALAPGNSGIGQGGGVFLGANKEPLALTNATLDANTAEGAGASSGGGNLWAGSSMTRIENTIVNAGAGPAGKENCAANGESQGNNIDSLDDCAFHSPGDRVNTNPLLGSLHENGGPVQTEALAPSSPAVDGGSNVGCPPTDARGVIRPQGSACDVGAFELAPPSASTLPATGIATTSATLRGSAANPDALDGTMFFQFGTTAAYGLQTTAQALSAGLGPTQFAAALSGLTSGTLYHFRAVSINLAGTAFGADQTLRTTVPVAKSPPPLLRPFLAGLGIHPSSLKPEPGKGASLSAAHKRRGATVTYSDSQAALTTFTVLSPRKGYRVGRRCQASRPKHHKGKLRRCTVYVSLGSFPHTDRAGANRFHFTGRAKGRPLRRGRYRLRAVARNAQGRLSTAVATEFKIIR
jgi:hypothetical protein